MDISIIQSNIEVRGEVRDTRELIITKCWIRQNSEENLLYKLVLFLSSVIKLKVESPLYCWFSWGALSITVIVVGNGIIDPSSNLGPDCVLLRANALNKGINISVLSPVVGKLGRLGYLALAREPFLKEYSECKL